MSDCNKMMSDCDKMMSDCNKIMTVIVIGHVDLAGIDEGFIDNGFHHIKPDTAWKLV